MIARGGYLRAAKYKYRNITKSLFKLPDTNKRYD